MVGQDYLRKTTGRPNAPRAETSHRTNITTSSTVTTLTIWAGRPSWPMTQYARASRIRTTIRSTSGNTIGHLPLDDELEGDRPGLGRDDGLDVPCPAEQPDRLGDVLRGRDGQG